MAAPTAVPMSSMPAIAPSMLAGVQDDDGDAEAPELLDRVRRREEEPAGNHEVRLERHDPLHVDALEGRDDRETVRLGRVGGDVLDLGDDAAAGSDREQRLGRGRRERDDPPRLGRDRDRACPRRR